MVSGGFDANFRQIAICENNCTNYPYVCGVIKHELIHAFDYCRAKVDLVDNMRHIACTEIRAANLMHCSYLSSLMHSYTPLLTIRRMHEFCVKEKAALSIIGVRNVSREEAFHVVDEVFDSCYRDLEPFGRRIKLKYADADAKRAYFDAKYYGYRKFDEEDQSKL